MSQTKLPSLAHLLICTGSLAAATALGGNVINVKPELSEDGYYEIGFMPTEDKAEVQNKATYAANFGYVDWTSLGFAAGDKVRLTGNILLDKLPTNLTYDWSSPSLKRIVFIKNDIVAKGSTFTVPENVQFCYSRGSVSVTGDTYAFNAPGYWDSTAFLGNLVVNGTYVVRSTSIANGYGDGYGTTISGDVSGTGKIVNQNWYTSLTLKGGLSGELTFQCANATDSTGFRLLTTNDAPTIKELKLYRASSSGAQYLKFNPNRSEPTTLTISRMSTSQTIDTLCVSSNATIRVGAFTMSDVTVQKETTEHGTVSFGTFAESSDNRLINVKDDINLTVENFHWNRPHRVSYANFNGTLNTSTFDFSKSGSYASVAISGKTPATLPRKILCMASKTNDVSLTVSEAAWTFPIDFAAENTDDVNANRCEGVGVLNVPATGTIEIAGVTEGAATLPEKWTEYPLMTCSGGGEALSSWQINFTGNWPEQLQKRIEVRPTGLYLLAKRQKGLVLLFR